MDAYVRVDGLRDMLRELRYVDAAYPREIRQVNKEAAEVVATEARSRVPVLSGRLKTSIKAGASQRSAYVKAGTNQRVPYAFVQEFGWPGHNIEAQPYIYPAIGEKGDEVAEMYGDKTDDVLRRAFPRGVS